MAGLDTSPPRHFPSFAAHSCLGGGFRIPEEPSNKYHARHLAPIQDSHAALARSYSPEQLIADLQVGQGAAEDLYSSAAVGNCVWHHIFPGEAAPPLPVTGINLLGVGDSCQSYQDSPQQQQQQCGVSGAWSTTTFRPSLALGHSLWDHDGTDFSTGYTTQKLSKRQPAQAAHRSRSTSSSRGRTSDARPRPRSAPPARPEAAAPSSDLYSSGAVMQSTNRQGDVGAAAAAAEATEAEHWGYSNSRTSTALLTNSMAAAEEERMAENEAGEPIGHSSQVSGSRPKSMRPGDGPYPNSWFSHTPVAQLAAEREAARHQQALLLSQFHPRPGAKHPSRSKAVHRTIWGSGVGAAQLGLEFGYQQQQDGQVAEYTDLQQEAGVQGEGGWLEAQLSLQEHDMFGSSRCSSSASSGELPWQQHPKEHHEYGSDGGASGFDARSDSVAGEEEERSRSSGGGARPLQQAPAAAQLGMPGGVGTHRGRTPFQDSQAWEVDAKGISQGARGELAAKAGAQGDSRAWWRSNAKLAALVQQMLQSPAQAHVQPLMPDMEHGTLTRKVSGALQSPLPGPRGPCQRLNSRAETGPTSDIAAAAAGMALAGRVSASLTWARYCNNLQATLAACGTGDTGNQVTPGDTLATPGVHRAAPLEQQHAAWVSELLDRPVKERLRLLELHSWAATHGAKANKAAKPTTATSDSPPARR